MILEVLIVTIGVVFCVCAFLYRDVYLADKAREERKSVDSESVQKLSSQFTELKTDHESLKTSLSTLSSTVNTISNRLQFSPR